MRQNDNKMKTAEREINRLEYAFKILKEAGLVVVAKEESAMMQEGEEAKSS